MMLKPKKMRIQNVLITSMMISAFSRQEMITRKWLSTLGHKATKDTTITLWYTKANKSKRFDAILKYKIIKQSRH
jgi:hypothetical protein